jgi:threonine/homoserine/homoserine lactone efflux protein
MISQRLINFAAAVGVLLGAIGFVRTGSIVVGAAIALTGMRQERRIERYLPLAIGVALVVVAIVLPHGR